jgi:hypothetical protein
VAPLFGVVARTFGGVVSTVLNVDVNGDASEFPATSLAPVGDSDSVAVEPDS